MHEAPVPSRQRSAVARASGGTAWSRVLACPGWFAVARRAAHLRLAWPQLVIEGAAFKPFVLEQEALIFLTGSGSGAARVPKLWPAGLRAATGAAGGAAAG